MRRILLAALVLSAPLALVRVWRFSRSSALQLKGSSTAKNTKLESLKRIEVLRKRGRQCLSQREVAHVTP